MDSWLLHGSESSVGASAASSSYASSSSSDAASASSSSSSSSSAAAVAVCALLALPDAWVRYRILPFLSNKDYVSLVGTCRAMRRFTLDPMVLQNSELHYAHAMEAIIVHRRNVFISGSAGSGKTVLLNRLKQSIDSIRGRHCTMTAPTGLAASGLHEGVTIHSVAALGYAVGTVEDLKLKLTKGRYAQYQQQWRKRDVLAVDEVGMLDSVLVAKMNVCAQHVRRSTEAMGGVIFIVAGDFYQLAPVKGTILPTNQALWHSFDFVIIDLLTSHRQKSDPAYYSLLQRVRKGEPTEEDIEVLQERKRITRAMDWNTHPGARPSRIHARCDRVQELNEMEFVRFHGAIDNDAPPVPPPFYRHGNENLGKWMAQDRVIEYNKVIVPASNLGGVSIPAHTSKVAQDASHRLTLGQALESVGAGLNQRAPLCLQFKIGVAYILTFNFNVSQGKCNGSRCIYIGGGEVEFVKGGRVMRLEALQHRFEVPVPKQTNLFVSRTQVGLRLDYSNTIHGVQGMTLDSAEADLGKSVFADCSAYVTLGRVTRLEDMFLSDFDPSSLKSSPDAKRAYQQIASEREQDPDYDPELFRPDLHTHSGQFATTSASSAAAAAASPGSERGLFAGLMARAKERPDSESSSMSSAALHLGAHTASTWSRSRPATAAEAAAAASSSSDTTDRPFKRQRHDGPNVTGGPPAAAAGSTSRSLRPSWSEFDEDN
jgi:hypothetical protein